MITVLTMLTVAGCSRAHYRLAADKQSYAILKDKANDPAWTVPRATIQPDPRSRFYDPCNPDNPPLPPDDPAAHQYLSRVDGMRGSKQWQRLGQLDTVENPLWPTYLGGQPITGSAHELPKIDHLTLPHAVELGLIHSREYQEQIENVYLSALALTGERYRFNVRPIGFDGEPGADLFYQHQPDDRSQWQLESARFGLSKLLPTGAQLVAELVNNTIWVFSGPNHSGTASSFAYTLVQPLLRGAGRSIVLESLTQAERGVLYTVRNFARFRKSFYVMVVTGERAIPLPSSSSRGELAFLIRGERSPTVGFNFMLMNLQLYRNYHENVLSLEGQLRDLKQLAKQGRATSLNITQVESSLQEARYMENRARRHFSDQLDRFKMQLGLPPDMDISVDDSLLDPFQFRNPELLALTNRISRFADSIANPDNNPEPSVWSASIATAGELWQELTTRLAITNKLAETLQQGVARREAKMTADQFADLQANLTSITVRKRQIQKDLAAALRHWETAVKPLGQNAPPAAQIAKLQQTLRKEVKSLQAMARDVSSLDLDTRVESVALKPVDLTPKQAVMLALEHRLDLMNQRAVVVDARRRMELAANRLKGTLNVVAEGELNTPPLLQNHRLLDFRADDSNFRIGVQVVTPLDRRRQRNDFRASQISYQRARRNYMAAEDQVKLDVRDRLRSVDARAVAFEIRRRGLRVAVRELEQAIAAGERVGPGGEQENQQGVNITRAIDNIIQAQNSLLFIWEDYEKDRLALFRDMGVMVIGPDGLWDEDETRRIMSQDLLEEVPLPAPEQQDAADQAKISQPTSTKPVRESEHL